MGKAKTSDRTRDIRCVAKLLRDGGYSYDQSKHLIAEARRRVGLTPPQRKKGSVDRLTREELEALRRAACLLSLRPLSIGRFERSSECEARSIRKTTARSISSLISAQSAGTTLCSTGSTSPDQSWSRRETPELYRIRLHVSACYPFPCSMIWSFIRVVLVPPLLRFFSRFLVPVDLFTGAVAPTTCSLTICLTICMGMRFARVLRGWRYALCTCFEGVEVCALHVENCPESPAPVDKKIRRTPPWGGFQRFKHPPQGTPATREAVRGGGALRWKQGD